MSLLITARFLVFGNLSPKPSTARTEKFLQSHHLCVSPIRCIPDP